MNTTMIPEYDYNSQYPCSPYKMCGKFTKLMYYVVYEKYFSSNTICDYIEENPNEINAVNELGWNALMIAVRISNSDSSLKTVKLLLDYGSDVNVRDVDGATPLMIACLFSNEKSNLETVKLLLDYRSDLNIQDNEGWSALMYTIRYVGICSNIIVIKLLLDHGSNLRCVSSNINLRHKNGYNALMIALSHGNTETIQLLLDYGASFYTERENEVKDFYGNSFLSYIHKKNKIFCLKLIEEMAVKKFKYQKVLEELLFCTIKSKKN
ncbi:putative ankyrin repeat protein [Cotonvirus japonicus]|uniref:Ankyrin repeat protein n=1 Tax=Cotonvirus japonicus TaxID=2811091 RepID=A0ABM7NUA9_9VIRU|nr:putative ankyrin repeat protein [Cotonvirus japonicus]BCS83647.1 putative ankyrin repeat protein [Cotonvirus japonicus]